MGTRNLTIVIKDNIHKVAQYGQWDGYPDGQGITILNFLSILENQVKLRKSLKKVRFINEKDLKDISVMESGWLTVEQDKTFYEKYPQLHRDLGGEILDFITKSDKEELLLQDDLSFFGSGLGCEYAWCVDLDNNTFGLYKDDLQFSLKSLPTEEEFIKAYKEKYEKDN